MQSFLISRMCALCSICFMCFPCHLCLWRWCTPSITIRSRKYLTIAPQINVPIVTLGVNGPQGFSSFQGNVGFNNNYNNNADVPTHVLIVPQSSAVSSSFNSPQQPQQQQLQGQSGMYVPMQDFTARSQSQQSPTPAPAAPVETSDPGFSSSYTSSVGNANAANSADDEVPSAHPPAYVPRR